MSIILQYVSYFDFFGSNYAPTVNNRTRQQTIFGGVLGIIFVSATIAVSALFSEPLISRDEPGIVQTFIVNEETRSNLTMGFGYFTLYYPDHKVLNSTKYSADMKFLSENMDRLITYMATYTQGDKTTYIPIKDCEEEDFHLTKNTTDPFFFRDDIKMKCFNKKNSTIELYKRSRYPGAKYVELNVYICENSTFYNNCLSYEEQNYYLENYEIRPVYVYNGLMVDIKNYGNPMTHYMDFFFSKTITFPKNLPVTHYIEVRNEVLETDHGLMSTATTTQVNQTISSQSYLVGGDVYDEGKVDKVFRRKINEAVIYTSRVTYQTSRSYPYIQDVIANIVGLMGMVLYTLQLFIQRIYDSMVQELVIHQIFNVNEETITNYYKTQQTAVKKLQTQQRGAGDDLKDNRPGGLVGNEDQLIKLSSGNNYIDIVRENFNESSLISGSITSSYKGSEYEENTNLNLPLPLKSQDHAQSRLEPQMNVEPQVQVKIEPNGEIYELNTTNQNVEHRKRNSIMKNKEVNEAKSGIYRFSERQFLSQMFPDNEIQHHDKNRRASKFCGNEEVSREDGIKVTKLEYLGSKNSSHTHLHAINDDKDKDVARSRRHSKFRRKSQLHLLEGQELCNENTKRESTIDPLTSLKEKIKANKTDEKRLNDLHYKFYWDSPLLNLAQHFQIMYCCCTLFGRIKRINKYYEKLSRVSREYTDIVNIAYNIFEVEKLKYLLLSDKELSIFNLRNKIVADRNKIQPSTEASPELDNFKYSQYFYNLKDEESNKNIKSLQETVGELCETVGTKHQEMVPNRRQVNASRILDFIE